jgi:hypothetical protein
LKYYYINVEIKGEREGDNEVIELNFTDNIEEKGGDPEELFQFSTFLQ